MDKRTPGQRLKEARTEKGISGADVAKGAGVKASTYAAHENGQNAFTPEQAVLYGRRLGVNPVWLVFGDDFAKRFVELERTHLRLVDPGAPPAIDPDRPYATVSSVDGIVGLPVGTIPQIDVTAGMGGGGIPVVAEGVPGKSGMTFAAEVIRDFWRLPDTVLSMFTAKATDLAIIPVQGDSMLPTLSDGDFVVVNTKHRWPSPDGIYALGDTYGGIIVKRLQVTSKPTDETQTVSVMSDNPKYETKHWLVEEANVVGRIVGRIGFLR